MREIRCEIQEPRAKKQDTRNKNKSRFWKGYELTIPKSRIKYRYSGQVIRLYTSRYFHNISQTCLHWQRLFLLHSFNISLPISTNIAKQISINIT
jgi:hypothetical protein